jgi:rhodanese-related sulfurtransferase
MKFAPSLLRLIERLRGSVAWIEAPELKRGLDHGEAVTVVDVRGPDEFTGPLGHITTARNIPVAGLVGRLTELAGLEGQPIVLVCRTDKRSATAARSLHVAGFARVSVLRRGMEQWNERGYAVDREAAEATGETSAAPHTALYPCQPYRARLWTHCSPER